MRKHIQRGLRAIGREIRRYDCDNSQWLRLSTMLRAYGVTVVLDIGASTGLFARELIEAGFQGRIVSFEPLAASHSALCNAARLSRNWTVAPRVALGATRGKAKLNVSANTGSSSFLPMSPRHIQFSPTSDYVAFEVVDMILLDDVYSDFVHGNDVAFVKLDVQGYEGVVLDGARKSLQSVSGLQLELSLETLYDGQPLFWDLAHQLISDGFQPWAFSPAFSDPATGRMLQVDGVFFRKKP